MEPWPPDGIVVILESEPYEAEDDHYGPGQGHFFGPTGESRIAFYPKFQSVEFENLTTYLVFKKPTRVSLTETTVMLETEGKIQSSFFAVDRDGQVKHEIRMNPETVEQVEALDRLADGRLGRGSSGSLSTETSDPIRATAPEPITEAPASNQVAPWEQDVTVDIHPQKKSTESVDSVTPEETPPARSQKEKKPRIDIKGRIGRLPTFKTTQRGKRMGRFPVAEHAKNESGEETTTWYTVAVFNAIAEQMEQQIQQGELKQGDEVRVVAYPQMQHVPDGRGGMKEQEIFFAALVKKPRAKTS